MSDLTFHEENTWGTKPGRGTLTFNPISKRKLTIWVPEYLNHIQPIVCECGFDISKFLFTVGQVVQSELKICGIPCPNVNCDKTYTLDKSESL